MPSVQYGNKTIDYDFLPKEGLNAHYITVEKGVGVILKGKTISEEHAQKLILKKAKWIIDKLELVRSIGDEDIVSGARIQYLGRKYYVQLLLDDKMQVIDIDFTESKFNVTLPNRLNNQLALSVTFENFMREKAIEKIKPLVKKLSEKTGLPYRKLKFMKLEKRWGSCTPDNTIILNYNAVKLPYSLIEYLIVHELVHTKIKNHSKEFWAELSKHIPDWKELDARMYGMKL